MYVMRSRYQVYIWPVLFLACLCSMDTTQFSTEEVKGGLRGDVGDKYVPFEGVIVTLLPVGKVTTSRSGMGEFYFSHLEPNTYYRLNFFYNNDFNDSTTLDSFYVKPFQITRCPDHFFLKCKYSYIRGAVIDSITQAPVSNAWVYAEYYENAYPLFSNANFSLTRIRPGTVRIFAGKDSLLGYITITAVADSIESDLEIPISPHKEMLGTITGTIVSATQQPIKGVRVSFVRGITDTVTNDSGRFVLQNIPQSCHVTLTVCDSVDSMKLANISIGQSGSIDIGTVVMEPVIQQGSIFIVPGQFFGSVAEGSILLWAKTVVSENDIRIRYYAWDLDNNGTWDTSTTAETFAYQAPGAGTHTVKVRCSYDSTTVTQLFSPTTDLKVIVSTY